MEQHIIEIISIIILLIIFILFLITLYNLLTVPKINIDKKNKKNYKNTNKELLVSILIPARNEEKNIEKALLSSINQTYQNIEIIVLDDKSIDKTSFLVNNIIKKYKNKNIKLIQGTTLPNNWNGKSWACFNLYKESTGDYLLFIDADVYLDKYAIELAIQKTINAKLDLLTIIPNQISLNIGENFLINIFMEWFVTTFLPIKLSNILNQNPFTAACGQFMLFKRSSYELINGHACVGKNIVEEREIAMKLREKKLKVSLFLTNDLMYCKMYENYKMAFNGFSNTFFAGSKLHPFLFIIFITLIYIAYITPAILSVFNKYFLLSLFLILIQGFIQSLIFKKDFLINTLFYPIKITLFFYTSITSCIKTLQGKLIWKDRIILQELN